MSQHSRSSSTSIDTSSTDSTISNTSYTLQQVLSNPKLLCSFEAFLRQTWSHENLLFIEALGQLKHENDSKIAEASLHRIYKTFLAKGSPLELNVTTQEKVRQDIQALQWAIVDRIDAVTILEETETQVLDMLKQKLSEFIQTMDVPIENINPTMIKNNQIHVVIVGGGFTGFTVASILDQMPRFYVTLIDTKDSFEYTPGIVRKIVNPEQSSSLRVRHDAYVRNGRVIIGYAEELCNKGKSIIVNDEQVDFEYLVIATGSSYSSQLKSSDTSSLYRMSGLEETYLELLKARRVLIIGGGLVGCELASEISQHTFPGAYPKKHVTLVDSHPNVVNRSESYQQSMARKYLEELGVEVVCNEKIIDFNSTGTNFYLGSSGRVYSNYDKVFFATGTRPNTGLFTNSTPDCSLDDCIDTWGRIRVKPTLQLEHWKYEHIFAGGDVTNVVEEKTGYAATISGVCIARNICRLVKGKQPLKQGTKGTLPAPERPLHGMLENGGIGKQNLNSIKKKFSFLNPSWAALKYFDEQQFLNIVQGQGSINSSQVLGRLPRKLDLPKSKHCRVQSHQSNVPRPFYNNPVASRSSAASSCSRQRSDIISAAVQRHLSLSSGQHRFSEAETSSDESAPRTSTSSNHPMKPVEEKQLQVLEGLVFEHFTYGDEVISLFASSASQLPNNQDQNYNLSPRPINHPTPQ
ncbi:hypothetical protein G6F37_009713 [Rhizopus arrhizus]|nr:hypothetical protein G6F38_009783 [Rhizopus arrhizus]KAG1154149.1 hypothetical protein G6F37_009713 [Rhizopus arrhizus]